MQTETQATTQMSAQPCNASVVVDVGMDGEAAMDVHVDAAGSVGAAEHVFRLRCGCGCGVAQMCMHTQI